MIVFNGEEKDKVLENVFDEIIAEIFPNLGKTTRAKSPKDY
jgi:hypothetical protein